MVIVGIAVAGTLLFCLGTSAALKWKALAAGLMALSFVLQFGYPGVVPHIVPFLMQIFVCLWMVIYWKMP